MYSEVFMVGSAVVVLVWLVVAARRRLLLSMAKHPSLRGHSRMARRLARLLPYYTYSETQMLACDGASLEQVQIRKAALECLAQRLRRAPLSLRWQRDVQARVSDLQLTTLYRVPFQFREVVQRTLPTPAVVTSSYGYNRLQDMDGNEFIDLSGAYGVNLLGFDFYKSCISSASVRMRDVGVVLGPYHPVVADNVQRLCEISGLDEVSFHMSGTEAVMQAVALARYHTRRSHVVRLCGAYHGWWDGVQPGPGNPRETRDVYTLKEMDTATLKVLEIRDDIACVLVNPIQALHPNASPPGDAALLDSARHAAFDREAYAAWLRTLREVCSRRGIVLIIDDIFMGFRLAWRGSQEYFGVRADMVTYGKTLGGGLPVGALCGRASVMRRFDPEHPADLCFARGTFNTHPLVMGAMNEFLTRASSPQMRPEYAALDTLWNHRAERLNRALQAAGVPVRVANMSSVFTIVFTLPARFNWLLQFYLRAEGVMLSWVGSGRLVFPHTLDDGGFDEVLRRLVNGAGQMWRDGWWLAQPVMDNRAIRRRVLGELLCAGLRMPPGRTRGPGATPQGVNAAGEAHG